MKERRKCFCWYGLHFRCSRRQPSNKMGEGEKSGDDSIRARTSDGQEVHLDVTIIFRLEPERIISVHIDWQKPYIEDFIRPLVRGFVRTQVSQFTVQEVNSSARKDLEATLSRLFEEELAKEGLRLKSFLLRDVTFSDEYAASIEQKQIALEGEERTKHEANQVRNLAEGERDRLRIEAEGERDKRRLEAEGAAEAALIQAQAQAQALKWIGEALDQNPDLLTYEYINKLSPNIRAMLVPNNAPLILPLDQMAGQLDMAAPAGAAPSGSATQALTNTMPLDVPMPTPTPVGQ